MLECQANYIVQLIASSVKGSHGGIRPVAIAATREATAAFDVELRRRLQLTPWANGCANWYTTASGRIVNNWCGCCTEYWYDRSVRGAACQCEAGRQRCMPPRVSLAGCERGDPDGRTSSRSRAGPSPSDSCVY
jgi:hypothetical protein